MANDDDFTFARVAPPVDSREIEKVADCINAVHVDSGENNASCGSSSQNVGLIWRGATSTQQESVGSLSFTVIDASSRKQVKEQPTLDGTKTTGNSDSYSRATASVRKPAPRVKVPFEKGYSQMDWLKLTRTHPDLAGLKGQSNRRLISLDEVKEHQSDGSMWTVLKGRVYNIAPYMKFHPGGAEMLMKAVGKDCTTLFNKYHAWVNAEFLLEKCLVGVLDNGPSAA